MEEGNSVGSLVPRPIACSLICLLSHLITKRKKIIKLLDINYHATVAHTDCNLCKYLNVHRIFPNDCFVYVVCKLITIKLHVQ